MELHSHILGQGRPVIILHGLLGMAENWMTLGRELASQGRTIHLVDQRNHGLSPHTPTHTYGDMAYDLLGYMDHHDLDSASLIGHSMGGKTAMCFSLLAPQRVDDLVVVDIAPVDYSGNSNRLHQDIFSCLRSINLHNHSLKGTIIKTIAMDLNSRLLAMFLAKNLRRDGGGNYYWMPNLPVLRKYLHQLHSFLPPQEAHPCSSVKTLFIRGDQSDYVQPEHQQEIDKIFQNSSLVTIPDAGHWLHADQPDLFIEKTLQFWQTG